MFFRLRFYSLKILQQTHPSFAWGDTIKMESDGSRSAAPMDRRTPVHMKPFRKILFPIDFSDAAVAMVPYVAKWPSGSTRL